MNVFAQAMSSMVPFLSKGTGAALEITITSLVWER